MNIATTPHQSIILGFDPGRQKCGLAIMGIDHQLFYHQVIASDSVIETINALFQKYPVSLLVMGNQTTAKEWEQRLLQGMSQAVTIVSVDERYSSLEARDRYWDMYPPRGLSRLVPRGMRHPDQPIDDIVAIILVERYLAQHEAQHEL